MIKNEPLNIDDSLSEASSESSTDDNANAHQYEACLPNTKKMKCSSEIEQLNCSKNCSKSRIGKNVEFDCGEILNNLRHVTRNCDLFSWIPALKLSNSDKHFILSGKPLSDKIMNVIMSKFNDLIEPYSKEGHNHRLQLIKAKLNHFVPCYKEVDGSFVQILKIYKFHWVVATNLSLCVTDNNDKTTVHTVYIFDAFSNASFRKKGNEVNHPIAFIQDICNIVSRPKNEIKFVLLNVPQASKREYAGFYAVAFTYIILKGRIVSRCAINQALLPDHLINFLNIQSTARIFSLNAKTSVIPQIYFIYRKVILPLYAARHWGTNERVFQKLVSSALQKF